MIKIITENSDRSGNEIIEYLISNNANFERIDCDNFSEYTSIISNEIQPEKDVVWIRRGSRQLNPNELLNYPFSYYIWKESDIVNKFYEKINKGNKNYFGDFIEEDQHNKLYDLYLAKECGFKIPETLITNKKKDVISFKEKHGKIITKSIKDIIRFKTEEFIYMSQGTCIVENFHLDELHDYFVVSKFQQYIEKEVEIRTFYFDDSFFAMAIFSQNDEKTKIDFRNYNSEKQNRCIAFNLPKKIIQKLRKFLKHKKIDTCSIDLILTPENEFVFLEINPQGQFNWVSRNCNYHIEKFIAEKLIDYEKTSQK
ncbi:hypothetical protein [Chryseobacterium sp. FH2]|uniref:hypothetical protein n=1 Tax=Chryseobacterium sp. FH2 TaxID=1674291 RepID=UPI00065AA9E8|nr:hypothetical protein [Chryseobacterium sp. FH2]